MVNCIGGINKYGRPIANKYREGKMKRTLERELKLPEAAEKEAVLTVEFSSTVPSDMCLMCGSPVFPHCVTCVVL